MRLSVLVGLAGLAACTSPLTYGNDVATAVCNNQQECNEEGFDALFDDFADCVDAAAPVFGGSCYVDHCDTFDVAQGNACLAAINTSSCDEPGPNFGEGDCADVWSDCAGLELGACLLSNAFGGGSD